MEKFLKNNFSRCVALLLLLAIISSCVPEVGLSKKSVSRSVILSESRRLLDENFEEIRTLMIENSQDEEESISEEDFEALGTFSGEEVVRSLNESDYGECLDLLYYSSSGESTVDDVLESSKKFLSEEKYEELEGKAREIEKRMGQEGIVSSRSLSPSQLPSFYNDLRSLVVKAVVLLTASVVYAFIPKVMLWGKVCAATAISVAAGVVASTIITVIQWCDKDLKEQGRTDLTFKDWITNITKEPMADWAIAESTLSSIAAFSSSPVVAAIILAVFAIYGIISEVNDLFSKYNFSV